MIVETKFNVGDEVYVITTNDKFKSMEIIGPVKVTKINFKETGIVDNVVPNKLFFYSIENSSTGFWETSIYRTYEEVAKQVENKFKPKPIDI